MSSIRAACLAMFATASAWAGSGVPLPEGKGKKIIEGACVSCHGLDVLAHKQWNREHWQTVVTAMVARGAPVKNGDVSELVGYLEKNFGEDRGKKLVEDICSLCHEWQRVEGHELTKRS